MPGLGLRASENRAFSIALHRDSPTLVGQEMRIMETPRWSVVDQVVIAGWIQGFEALKQIRLEGIGGLDDRRAKHKECAVGIGAGPRALGLGVPNTSCRSFSRP